MPDDDTFQIRHYREGTDGKIPCPKCGALIALESTTCHECGVHFRGHAVDFDPASYQYRDGLGPVMRHVAVIVLLLFGIIIVIALVAIIGGA